MQDDLFGPADAAAAAASPASAPSAKTRGPRRGAGVQPAAHDAALHELGARLPPLLHLGTSTWSYPGWDGLVWSGEYGESKLARQGLSAYARHPLLRCAGIDRSFYRPPSSAEYAADAAQVPEDFRFVVKAPALVSDPASRDAQGRPVAANPFFLDAQRARLDAYEPAVAGLGRRLGALVFQLSPLPPAWLNDLEALYTRLEAMLQGLPRPAPGAPDTAAPVIAVQVRDAALLTPRLARLLRESGATYCLGLDAKMPAIEQQLPMLRALWPGPLVCRWTLHRRHGAYGYERAQQLYEPYTRLADPDPRTREQLAKVALATVRAGWPAYLTIGNKAEGCAPLSVVGLAEAIAAAAAA